MADLAPVHFISHGTSFMLGEDTKVKKYWKKLGQDALDHGCKGVIIMGAHWNSVGNKILVAMNPKPNFMPLINAHPDLWRDFQPNPDLETGRRVVRMLREAGIDADEDPKFDWMIDTEISIVGLFGCKTPPITIISQDSHWDPFYHIRIGTALRPLRKEGYLIIGSGGATHNLYNTDWKYMINYKDVLAMEHPPDAKSLEFRQAFQDVIMKSGGGPDLRRGLARLMKHPYFRDAHGTDEHYISACFVAGAVGEPDDKGTKVEFGAEAWELTAQCNSQYTLGSWPSTWLVNGAKA